MPKQLKYDLKYVMYAAWHTFLWHAFVQHVNRYNADVKVRPVTFEAVCRATRYGRKKIYPSLIAVLLTELNEPYCNNFVVMSLVISTAK